MQIDIFRGERVDGETIVSMETDKGWRPLPLHLDKRNHSPTGFEWGYGGSGPAQLALAICTELVGWERAQHVYMLFKDRVISQIYKDSWLMIGSDIVAWIKQREAEARESHAPRAVAWPFPERTS